MLKSMGHSSETWPWPNPKLRRTERQVWMNVLSDTGNYRSSAALRIQTPLYMEHPDWCNTQMYNEVFSHTQHTLLRMSVVCQLVWTSSVGHHQATQIHIWFVLTVHRYKLYNRTNEMHLLSFTFVNILYMFRIGKLFIISRQCYMQRLVRIMLISITI